MRNRMMIIAVVGIMLLVVGCSTEYREITTVESPCWTDNGKIAYIKEYKKWKIVHNTLGEDAELIKNELILMECNNDGTGKEEKGLIFDDWWYPLSMNSSGIWIVMSVVSGDSSRIYAMKTDGTGLQLLGEGLYPDLSPDGIKIVYSKKNEGIWIMNRNGGGDYVFLDDTNLTNPQWSPDGEYIAVNQHNTRLKIYNTVGVLKKELNKASLDSDTIKYLFDRGYCWSREDINGIYLSNCFIRDTIAYRKSKILFNINNDSLEISYYDFKGINFKVYNNKVIAEGVNWIIYDLNGNQIGEIEP